MKKKLDMVGKEILFTVTGFGPGDVESVIDEIEGLGGSVNQIEGSIIEGKICGDSKELTKKVKKLLELGWST
jgi:hypothetical protein